MSEPSREHLLACLAEECGEVVQVVGKCLRFGEHDCHPKTNDIKNIDLLFSEINDLLTAAIMLGYEIDEKALAAKYNKINKYWQYAEERKNERSESIKISSDQ